MKNVIEDCTACICRFTAVAGQYGRRVLFLVVCFCTPAFGQVSGSPHDLSGGNTGTDEVCVFCHTPHGADVSASVPLWNKILPTTTYTQYSTLGTASFDSAQAPVGSVSLACLSCHDGSQAVDVVLNAPGSGNYEATGIMVDGSPLNNTNVMTGTPIPAVGFGGDLTDDHPISIQYGGGGADEGDPDGPVALGSLTDPDFELPVKATINGNSIWWVDSPGGNNGTREKTDMLLYTRDEGGVQPFVECGSCHDPHNAASATTGEVAFLRISNTGSQLCTSCHIK